MRAAITAAGIHFIEAEGGADICPATSIPAQVYWVAGDATDFGPAFALWVYPNEDALAEDWDVVPGERPESRLDGCDAGSGFVYWNANLIWAFAYWGSAGHMLSLSEHHELPNEEGAGRAGYRRLPGAVAVSSS